VVAGSNPVSPTWKTRSDQCRSGLCRFWEVVKFEPVGQECPKRSRVGRPSAEECGAGCAKVFALGVRVDRQ
jgi:hypothetical protein